MSKKNHFGVLTKDESSLIIWYSDETNEVNLLENLE